MSADKGVLVAIEGIDGAGKTTQVERLQAALEGTGEPVIATKEPTHGYWGQKIRASAQNGRMPPYEELRAFKEDRKEHLQTVIRPALADGKIVLLDRYFYSTVAYQGPRAGDIAAVEKEMRELADPADIAFVLDLDPELALMRVNGRDAANKFEKLGPLTKSRKVFQQLCETDPAVFEIDGSMSIDAVYTTLVRLLVDHGLRAKRCPKNYQCDNWYYCGFRMTGTCRWWQLAQALIGEKHSQGLPALKRSPVENPLSPG